MRWRGGRRSSNVEDRRRVGGAFPLPGARRGGIRVGRKTAGGGIGAVILVLAMLYFGVDPSILMQGGPGGAPAPGSGQELSAEDNRLAEFVSVVLADTEDSWHELFAAGGERYEEPTLVLFSGYVQSACGFAQAAVGPFYCPGDRRVYIDLAFYRDLQSRFGAPGDFAQAYVIAHEVGHHVQNLLGILPQVHQARQGLGRAESNDLSVRLELQADCLAGLWAAHAHRSREILEPGDVDEALNAAAAIGDDRLQRQTTGRVTPDSFTHGTSEQRARWFRRGMQGGSLADCDTFAAAAL